MTTETSMAARKPRKSSAADKKPAKKPVATIANDDGISLVSGPEKTKKLLLVAHNHPQFFPGGAEILAYDLFKSVRETTHYKPFFLAGASAVDRQVHTATPFQMLVDAEDEMLFWGDAFDYLYQSQKILPFMYHDFKGLLKELQPDVVHFHHSIRIGLEALHMVKQAVPHAKIVYTLHEYILICNRDGQMVRKHNNELCDRYSPNRCHKCFPEISPQLFKMREEYLKSHLELVDMFVSPSHFLIDRFVKWGLPKEKMIMLENGRHIVDSAPHRPLKSKKDKRNVFGFFGQINPYKGALLTLNAVKYLLKHGFDDFRLELFGNVELQTDEFKEEFYAFCEKYKDNVTFHGKYKNDEMASLMEYVDWVIVPSTWWENSPLVIQEVFMHQRPIVCSDIGGMAEKVEDGKTGLHFEVRNEVSLAKTMMRAVEEDGLWEELVGNIGPRMSIEECARQHVALYDSL